jgi:hypothetical protein
MREKMEKRYYISERGELPAGLILLGSDDEEGQPGFLFPNFLDSRFDFRKRVVEYDPLTGLVYEYTVPGRYHFIRREEQKGSFYYYTPRDVSLEGIEMKLAPLDRRAVERRKELLHNTWVEDVRYNLGRQREDKQGGGLFSIDIPIHLPKQLEWILGKGEATNLTVSGRERISIGGNSRWCANCPQTEGRPRQQKFPDLDMEQQLTVNLHGNIGEKIHVNIDHSSMGGGMQSTNRIRINYKGLEDEIIKLIEMGDTDLTLSGAQLISYSGTAKGLFGVKTTAQVGPLDLTVIASKEEGETASGTFTAQGGQSSSNSIPDYAFVRRQFFYFENPGYNYVQSSFYDIYPLVDEADTVELYLSLRTITDEWRQVSPKFYISAYPDTNNDGTFDAASPVWEGWCRPLIRGQDFELIEAYETSEAGAPSGVKKYIGFHLFQRLDEDRAVVACYKSSTGTLVGDYGVTNKPNNTVGVTEDEPLTAELICPDISTGFSPSTPTWHMMMRNIYFLGLGGVEEGSLDIKIEDLSRGLNPDIHEPSNLSYIRIFGLDREDVNGDPKKDDKVDLGPGVFNARYSYLQIPWFEPFNPPVWVVSSELTDTTKAEREFVDTSLVRNPKIYRATTDIERQSSNKYNIVVEATSGQRTFQLNAFDIIEQSEAITVDGQRLARGSDYDIDYTMGSVTLKGEILTYLAINPDAKVSVDYQHKPLIGGGTSSLLGVGANLNLSTNSRLNGTFLYNSMGAPKYNPRLGEEPGRMMAADLNGSFQFKPRLMTSLVNLLPRVDTDTPSSLNLSGEVAASFPNPNTKGEAFIDDMEGIEDSDIMSLIRKSWYEASPPLDPADPAIAIEPTSNKFYWFNPSREAGSLHLVTTKRDLNPRLDLRENSDVTSVILSFPEPEEWCGIMTGFPGGIDLTNAQYLEIWVNDYQPDSTQRSGVLHIDFGKIDEDFYEPGLGLKDDENALDWIRDRDDTGFEGETCRYPTNIADAWSNSLNAYVGINCRNGNTDHDSEDLNKNGRLDETNSYYSLILPLNETALIDVQYDFQDAKYNEYWNEGNGENKVKAWRMYRLDLSKVAELYNEEFTTQWDVIQHMRIWIEDLEQMANNRQKNIIQIAGLKFVGNRWEFNGIRNLSGEIEPSPPADMNVKIGSINNKEDPEHYKPPSPVGQEEGIENREQSLILKYENFEAEKSFRAVKRFFGKGQDYQQYREVQFFLRADSSVYYFPGCSFFLKIAYDSLNYYEIEVLLDDKYVETWQHVKVNLSDLTNLKFEGGDDVQRTIKDAVDPKKVYTAKLFGNPTLFQVRNLFVGLRNGGDERIPAGQVFFNELRLGSVRRDIDHAERLSAQANFANVLSIGASWQRTGPEFRSLRQKKGSGTTRSNLSLTSKTEVNYFIPTLGFKLPVSFSYGTSTSLPKYLTQSDVEIADRARRDALKNISRSYKFNITLSRRGSTNFLLKNLFDNLQTGFSYSKKGMYSPTARDTTWSMSGNLSYQIQFRKKRELSLFKGIKWRYWLTSFSYSSNASRTVNRKYSFSGDAFTRRPSTYHAGWNNEISSIYDPFESIKINFHMSERRNLGIDHYFHGVPIGVQETFRHNIDLQYQPRGQMFLLTSFNPSFKYSSRYEEDLKPGIRQKGDPFGTRDAWGDRSMNFAFDVDVGRYVTRFGEIVHLIDKSTTEKSTGRSRRARSRRPTKQWDPSTMQKPGRDEKVEGEPIQQLVPGGGKEQPPPPAQEPARETPPGDAEAEQAKTGGVADLGAKRARTPVQETEQEEDAEADEEKEKKAEADTTAGKRPDPFLLLKEVIKFAGKIDPVKTTIRLDHNSRYYRIYGRSGIPYQLGLSDRSGALGAPDSTEQNRPEKASDNMVIALRSGVEITRNLAIDISANITKSKDEYRGRVTESDRWTWPDLNLSWRGLENKAFLKRFIKQSSMNVSFLRKQNKMVNSEESSYTLAPSWNFLWKNSLSTNVAFTYSQSDKTTKGQTTWSKNWSVNFDMRYDFKGKQGIGLPIPFLRSKKIKFESELTTTLNVSYSNASSYSAPPSSTLMVSPKASYKFSRNVTGMMSVDYKRTAGGIYGYINHDIGVHVTAEFKF